MRPASCWRLDDEEYDVSVKGYSCAKADGYVKKPVTHKVSNGFPSE